MKQTPAAGRSRGLGEEGQAALELALVLPVLLLLVTGMCTYGLATKNYMVLTDAVNEAARQLAVSRGQTTDPCATVAYSVSNAAPSLNSAKMAISISINGASYSGTSCSSASTYSGAAGNLLLGVPATVTVNYSQCAFSMYGRATTSCSLVATTTELVQ